MWGHLEVIEGEMDVQVLWGRPEWKKAFGGTRYT